MIFTSQNKRALQEFLVESSVHDAYYEEFLYNWEDKKLFVSLYNSINNKKIDMVFEGISILITTNLDIWGTNNTLLSLTVEDDALPIQSFLEKINGDNKSFYNSLYVVFQNFSGNEMHIICEKVYIS